ncbi:MAG TPA: response regulator [Caldimonas sp.]|jgi:CheY-like chemotaxis protein|nr:response regulator [Caldimonas sp.]HEX2539966.1 response regulator [Caldimonas sp.]
MPADPGPSGLAAMPQPGPLSVLIADDNPDAREMLAEVMALMLPGVTTLFAGDGLDAVSVAIDVSPWAVFLDLDMPVLDGVEAARRLRERMGDQVPVLIASSGDHERLREAYPVFDYSLRKPIDVQRLARYLSRAIVFAKQRQSCLAAKP